VRQRARLRRHALVTQLLDLPAELLGAVAAQRPHNGELVAALARRDLRDAVSASASGALRNGGRRASARIRRAG
jgi:hypothetical protein